MQMIVRLGVSGTAVALAALPALLMPACLGSSTPAAADGGSSSSSSSSGGNSSSSSGSGGGSSSSGSGGVGDAGSACSLDDMSSSATATGGYWFTYSDRTCDNSALIMADAAGTLSPVEGYESNPAADMATIPAIGMPVGYREFKGGGEKRWGAGFGFNLLNNGTNPFTVCPASTCTGTPPAVDAAVGFPAPYDATMHKGISFYAKSLMATAALPTKVRIQLSDKHTDPGSGTAGAAAASGMCDLCDNSQGGLNRCTNDFFKAVTIGPDWTLFTVLFSEIATDTWTKTYAKGMFDPATLYHVHFQLNGAAASPVPNFDIQVACISWVDM